MTDVLPGWLVELATLCGVVLLLAVAAVALIATVSGLVVATAVILRHFRKEPS